MRLFEAILGFSIDIHLLSHPVVLALPKTANVNVALIYFSIFIDTQARKTAAATDGSAQAAW